MVANNKTALYVHKECWVVENLCTKYFNKNVEGLALRARRKQRKCQDLSMLHSLVQEDYCPAGALITGSLMERL